MTRTLTRVALAALLTVSLAATIGSAPTAAATESGECIQNDALQTGNISATAIEVDSFEVRLSYELADGEDLTVRLPGGGTIVSASGFKNTSDGGWKVDGSTNTPEIVYSTDDAPAMDSSDGFYRTPNHPVGEVNLTAPEGVVSRSVMYLGGKYSVHTDENGCETIRVVAPCNTQSKVESARVASQVANASEALDVGHRHDETTLFAAERGPKAGGRYYHRGDAVVRASHSSDASRSTWIHEYVHSRQDFRTVNDMKWFVEASATYYSVELRRQSGSFSNEQYNRAFAVARTGIHNGVLTDSDGPHYQKGALVLHELDRRIKASGENSSLEDVFYRLNAGYDDEGVSYEEFRTIVAEESDTSTAQWLDEHVRTDANPEYHAVPEKPLWESFDAPDIVNGGIGFAEWFAGRMAGLPTALPSAIADFFGLSPDEPTCSTGVTSAG